MAVNSTVLITLVLLIGATVPSFAGEEPKQTFTCSAKTFNECLMEAPCSAWKRLGPKGYQLNTKIIFRGNPVEGETISGGTMGEMLETKCGKKQIPSASDRGSARAISQVKRDFLNVRLCFALRRPREQVCC
jgi:hypothetical protein